MEDRKTDSKIENGDKATAGTDAASREADMKKKLRSQRFKRYALFVLGCAIVLTAVFTLKIEGKDSLLADGQGNIVIGSGEDAQVVDPVVSGGTELNQSTAGDEQGSETSVQDGASDAQENASDEKGDAVSEEGKDDSGKSENADETKDPKDKITGSGDVNKDEKADNQKKTSAEKKSEPTDSGKNKKEGDKNKSSGQKKTTEKQEKELSALSDSEKAAIDPEDIKVDNSGDATASNNGNKALRPKEPKPVTVTLEIRCDRLSEDMSKLENEAIRDYIPEDGVVLKKTTYHGTTDNTVFDALNTLTRNSDIQLEFEYTPIYESYYIEGINFLYEFDAGPASGWMYKVNGWFPNYGCSGYYLSDGDEIVWAYTVSGYGADLGASVY